MKSESTVNGCSQGTSRRTRKKEEAFGVAGGSPCEVVRVGKYEKESGDLSWSMKHIQGALHRAEAATKSSQMYAEEIDHQAFAQVAGASQNIEVRAKIEKARDKETAETTRFVRYACEKSE